MNEREFIAKRSAAHAAEVKGIASDPLVQAALAQHEANMQVKAAIAARAKGNVPQVQQPVETAYTVARRQAG